MKASKPNRFCTSVLLISLVCSLSLATSCTKDIVPQDPVCQGIITSYNEFGAAMFDFTEADMTEAGFTLGDVISITIDGNEIIMPYYDGFYTRNGEYLCVAYPTYPSICFTANNVGLPEELTGLEGHSVTVRMKEKGGSLDVQQALSLKYTNIRSDYPISDEEFANARAVKVGNIASGVLHRCSSPFKRAPVAPGALCRALYGRERPHRICVRTAGGIMRASRMKRNCQPLTTF